MVTFSDHSNLARKIYTFYKTEHFIQRQWLRGIQDCILIYALHDVCQHSKETHIVVSRSLLKMWKTQGRYHGKTSKELFIVIQNGHLITAYFANFTLGMYARNRNCETILIQSFNQ
jgi:hypothetical protein